MTAVSNTSPLNYLLLIGEARVLPALFGSLRVPATVRDELLAPEASELVRQWASVPPDWVELHTVKGELAASILLHRGETDALLLARELRADVLLMDELDGRAVARQLGLSVIGTLGVLDLAAARGLLDFREAWQRLRATSFRAAPRLVAEVIDRDQVRRAKNEPK
jgi:predicted nucleic acid-binding protein